MLGDDIETITFRIRLVDISWLPFSSTWRQRKFEKNQAPHLFLGLNKNFNELKSGDKSMLLNVFEKELCHQLFF